MSRWLRDHAYVCLAGVILPCAVVSAMPVVGGSFPPTTNASPQQQSPGQRKKASPKSDVLNFLKEFDLSREQQQKVDDIQNTYRPKIEALEKQLAELKEKVPREIESVLSREQQTKLATFRSAHELIRQGKELFRLGKTKPRGDKGQEPSLAQQKFEAAMRMLDGVLGTSGKPATEAVRNEAMMAIQYWLYIHRLNGIEPPAEYPLKNVWLANKKQHSQIKNQFIRETEMMR